MSNNTLLIDADIIAYKFALRNQFEEDFGDPDNPYIETNLDQAMLDIDRFIKGLLRKTKSSDYLCFITGKKNFRYELLETYKGNRSPIKPLLLQDLRQYLLDYHNGHIEDRLEADDLLGLYSHKVKNPVIATLDKDLKIVPEVPIYDWKSRKTIQTSPQEALRFHMWQTLVGDKTDNYKGCPYIGPKKAEKILNRAFEVYTHAYGDSIALKPLKQFYWKAIVDTYETRDLTETDAFIQARCAYILNKPEDFDFKSKDIQLWSPS